MNEERRQGIPIWIWFVAAVVAVGGAAILAYTNRAPDPPESFRYEVGDYEEVDPALIVFSEAQSFDPGIPNLHALAATSDGRIYAAGEDAVAVLDLDGQELARHGFEGEATCMAVAPAGEILLGLTDRVAVLNPDGSKAAAWTDFGELVHITSIAVDADRVYVADAGNRVVLALDRQGAVQARIGEKDEDKDIPGFIIPSPYLDVAIDNMGAFWAVNPGRHGLEQYRPDGTLASAWYRPSMGVEGFCGCCNPTHIAFQSDGTLVTSEKGLARVKLYSVDQKLAGLVADPKAFHAAETGPFSSELETPIADLAVDARDRVLVADSNRNEIRVFVRKEAS